MHAAGRLQNQDGAVIVEVMIVLPILLLIGAFMVEMSNLFLRQQQVITALRAAGDYVESCELALPKCTLSSERSRVTEILRQGILGNTTGVAANQMAIRNIGLTIAATGTAQPRLAVLQVDYSYTGGALFAATFGVVSTLDGSRSLVRRVLP